MTNDGDETCVLEGPPAAALLDSAGTILIASNGPVGGGQDVELPGGMDAQLFVAVGNWCNDPPRSPLSIGLTFPDGARLLVPPTESATFEPPPCNGPGQAATISVQSESWTIGGG